MKKIGYVYALRESDLKKKVGDIKRIVGELVYVDVFTRKSMKEMYMGSGRGTELYIHSLLELGDTYKEIHQFCVGWIKRNGPIYVIEDRTQYKRESDLSMIGRMRAQEEELTKRRIKKWDIRENVMKVRQRKGKLSDSQIRSIIAKRKNDGRWAGKKWTFPTIGRFYQVNEKTARNAVRQYLENELKKSGLITD